MKKSDFLHLDEKNHVEEPFLQQLEAMPPFMSNSGKEIRWNVLRLKMGIEQTPQETQRQDFLQVIMENDLQEALIKINPTITTSQIFEATTELISFTTENIFTNNEKISELLTKGTKVRAEGKPNEDVFFIDFNNPENNTFTAISQFKIRVTGTDKHIYPDIVCFINGIPIVVIECKSPKTKEPMAEAIDQLMRYSNNRGYSNEGSRNLFYYNQFVVSTSRNKAMFGTLTTTMEKHFYRWTDPYPITIDELAKYCNKQQTYFTDTEGKDEEDTKLEMRSSPNDQQRLIHGMLSIPNLLSIIKTFCIWTTTDDGKKIKVVGRYQQLRAVKKTVERFLTGKNRDERSGIIWHTQGSGKSLTMVFLIREMYLHPKLQSYKVVLLTDRTQLEEQITETAQSVGYTVKNPTFIGALKTELKNDNAEIVSAMIHKFQEKDYASIFPELNASEKIILLTDEAHRSQYTKLGANLDKALPNATRIAFTGTPIERTEKTYGEYIDKYTMRQAIKDGVTLEIVYEGRTHNANINDKLGADKKFEDVFSNYSLEEKVQILGFASRMAYLEAEETINEKAKDMLKHYVQHVFPNKYKAQIVAVSKDAAHRYSVAIKLAKQELLQELEKENPNNIDVEALKKLEHAVVFSNVDHNEKPYLKEYNDNAKRQLAIAGFKLKFGKVEALDKKEIIEVNGNIGILIVVDMLLTGFDAPIEQVMYLDKVIVNHNLLQAIARVNRVYDDNKKVGFVVDYVGMGNHMKKALDAYWEKEQEEITGCLSDTQELLNELKTAHEELVKVFQENNLNQYSEADDIFSLFYDEDIRHNFTQAFDKFSNALDNVYPRKEALDYLKDLIRFAEINTLASQHFRDSKMSMKGVSDKLRSVTDEFLKSKGIEIKVEPISILDDNFFENIKSNTRERTKAAAIEHAIRQVITITEHEDPELYASFTEELQKILIDYHNKWDIIYKLLEDLRAKMKKATQENTYGLHRRTQMPIFRKLKAYFYDTKEPLNEDEINTLVICTKHFFGMLKTEMALINFWGNPPAVKKLEGEMTNYLIEKYSTFSNIFSKRKEIVNDVMAWSKDEKNMNAILYTDV